VKLFAILAATITLMLVGCGRTPPDVDTSQIGTTQFSIDERTMAPMIAGPSLATGEVVDVADYAGEVTVINAWASWCAPCLTEMPILIAAKSEYPNVRFLGLNTLDDQTSASQFAEDLGLTFDSIRDPEGEILASIPGLPPRALPSSIVLDKQGRIATRIIGPVEDGQLNTILDELLSE
jgi:thiol-disulfide isomerase/thioredoxin